MITIAYGSHRKTLCSIFLLLIVATTVVSCTGATASPPSFASPSTVPPTITPPPASPTFEALPVTSTVATEIPISISGLSSISYILPLTVQHVTDTTALVFFELDAAQEGVVLISPIGDSSSQQPIAFASETHHLITLTGLTAGTTYEVAVGLGSDEANLQEPGFAGGSWGSIQITTASNEVPLRVGVIGDSGFGDPTTYDLAAEMATYNLDFVIQTGDAVYNIYENSSAVEAFAQKWYLPLSPLLHEMPVYPVVGNHDIEPAARDDQGIPFYYRAFPPFEEGQSGSLRRWAAFGRNGIQFLLLDTQAFYGEADNEAQSAWLAERLADTQYHYTVAAFHIPPFSSDILHPLDGLPIQTWSALFEQANVPLVVSGHAHDYERLEQNGITYIVSGGGSQTLYGSGLLAPQSKIFVSRSHFTLLDIYADHVEIAAISKDGDILDQATISTP